MRRIVLAGGATILALGVMAGPAVASGDGQGMSQGPDACDSQHNNLRGQADPVELEPGDVVTRTSDPEQDNFEAEFDFYRVDHGLTDFDETVYREPVRLGPDNYCLGASSGTGSFWFGVTAPDGDGIQHKIDHKGKIWLYFDAEGGWKSLELQFDGKGQLRHANGVAPQ
ncbi:hypothetical protein SAMN06265360_1021 [Haloechinothrix alba]|uniref:Uncharacterized protein n=1 Tax=Haloechinothrix alba TaxID=664784 RepID=A0A238VBM0_9PSEU|nr:hypothetical protein [Haloechinothrix alba]SNR31578.1 hypothetical protein SAMN06265360_1021 [Haloechinothrix alba]